MKLSNIVLGALTLIVAGAAHAAGPCPNGTQHLGKAFGKDTCGLRGSYTKDMTLTENRNWVLMGGVFIGNDNKQNASLYIQPGTTIYGQSGADFLVITRGSKIVAKGTQQKPIVFTAAKTSGRTRGEWGGLIINGNAPINSCKAGTPVCEAQGEGSTGLYGGNNPADNSGVLRYVVVEWAGYEITPENELNGIAFQGVGNGTSVDYIQVHMNADDGVEFFGGTVNLKHVYLTGNKDDSLDWTSGWQGKAQFVVVKQADDQGNNGIEGDNLKSPQNADPRSNPTLANMTFIGTTGAAAKGGAGMLLRRGTGAQIRNSVITGFKKSCIDIDDEETFRNGATGNGNGLVATGITMKNSVVYCPSSKHFEFDEKKSDGSAVVEPWAIENWFSVQTGNQIVDPKLNGIVPATDSPLLRMGETPGDSFFEPVDYAGAISGPADDWTRGWTTNKSN